MEICHANVTCIAETVLCSLLPRIDHNQLYALIMRRAKHKILVGMRVRIHVLVAANMNIFQLCEALKSTNIELFAMLAIAQMNALFHLNVIHSSLYF